MTCSVGPFQLLPERANPFRIGKRSITMETVSRVLSGMKSEKLIELPALHELVIRDLDSLQALADGEETI
jgi:hypothetical protein